MKTVILSLLILVSLPISIMGQTISGLVTSQDFQPIAGAYILHIASSEHTHSNEEGKYHISGVKLGDTLIYSHLGFEVQTVVITDLNNPLEVQLQPLWINIDEVVISSEQHPLNLFASIDLQRTPVNSSQEILRKVPGLMIGQHAGGGKAEQIFLRGFDIDHGTDISISANGMPVNMVSHAHGQGYSDLHFLIPETIENIDFGKGPYYAEQGNFATAGYVDFKLKNRLDHSLVKQEIGMFGHLRSLGLISILDNKQQSAYIASEFLKSDGPFESPQNFDRINLMGAYTTYLSNYDQLSVQFQHFSSEWDASGQIPQRAVEEGRISRFGAIDDTEGGQTSRSGIVLNYQKELTPKTYLQSTLFGSQYEFELYSNFTFFLEDSINGDQIKQQESRQLFGLQSEVNHLLEIGGTDIILNAGAGFRLDRVDDIELSHTANRSTTLKYLQYGDINESNNYGFAGAEILFGKWVVNPAVRYDYFDFEYKDQLGPEFTRKSQREGIISPKLNILFKAANNIQLYLKSGKGFHSNDTRLVVFESGDVPNLAAVYGSDLGMIWKPFPNVMINTALWYLYSEDELVYVGDAGIVESSGQTRRTGVDLAIRYQPISWLYFNLDASSAKARSIGAPEIEDYVPLAAALTASGGVSVQHPSGFYGSLRNRYIGDRPANEDYSIVAEGYFITDLNLGYQWRQWEVGVIIENLFDKEWNETQFATESKLQNEVTSVEEIHFTPGTPFFFRTSLSYRF